MLNRHELRCMILSEVGFRWNVAIAVWQRGEQRLTDDQIDRVPDGEWEAWSKQFAPLPTLWPEPVSEEQTHRLVVLRRRGCRVKTGSMRHE